jgi:hypothetical protein
MPSAMAYPTAREIAKWMKRDPVMQITKTMSTSSLNPGLAAITNDFETQIRTLEPMNCLWSG